MYAKASATDRTAISNAEPKEESGESSWHERWTENEDVRDERTPAPPRGPPPGFREKGEEVRFAQMTDGAVTSINHTLDLLMDSRRLSEKGTREEDRMPEGSPEEKDDGRWPAYKDKAQEEAEVPKAQEEAEVPKAQEEAEAPTPEAPEAERHPKHQHLKHRR